MISGLVRFILLFLIGYIIFSFVSFIVKAVIRALSSPEGTRREQVRPAGRPRGRSEDGKGTVIELDRDQYKVE